MSIMGRPLPFLLSMLFSVLLLNPACCQEGPADTLSITGTRPPERAAVPDTAVIQTVAGNHIPRKAALLSAAFPGLGQIYNKKYWKLPIIYGGFATLSYLVILNDDQYRLLRRAYIAVRNNEQAQNPLRDLTNVTNLSAQRLETAVDQARRFRELNIILIAGLFGLQIMDAIVDAHLIEFNVNEDLALELRPSAGDGYASTQLPMVSTYGLSLTLKIK